MQRVKKMRVGRDIGVLAILAALTLISIWPNTIGEDIQNARDNFRSDTRLDFWGSSSSVFFGYFPEVIVSWQTLLTLTQITFCLYFLYWNFRFNESKQLFRKSHLHILAYFLIILSSQVTRDGIMLSLTLLSLGLLFQSQVSKHSMVLRSLSGVVLILAASFRPWLSISLFIVWSIVLARFESSLLLSKKKLATGAVVVALLPLVLISTQARIFAIEKSFPEQQVFLMDFAGVYCSTTNEKTERDLRETLEYFYPDDKVLPKEFCSMFRPDTWESLYYRGLSSGNEISLLSKESTAQYNSVRQDWIQLSTRDPISYFQNKLFQLTKILVVSDSRNIRAFTAVQSDEEVRAMRSLYLIPFDIAISLHLISPLVAIFSGTIWLLRRNREKIIGDLFKPLALKGAYLSIGFWIAATLIAYIGSNGRYLYSSVALFAWLLLSESNRRTDARVNPRTND